MTNLDVTKIKHICKGLLVEIILDNKNNEEEIKRGYVREILSKKDNPDGIRVVLTSGHIGNVQDVITQAQLKKENFKFYNLFFYDNNISSIWDKVERKYVVLDHKNPIKNKNEKIAFLFNDVEKGKDTLKVLNNSNYILKRISRKKMIVENFKNLDIEYFSINKERKLSYEKMIEWETYFKSN